MKNYLLFTLTAFFLLISCKKETHKPEPSTTNDSLEVAETHVNPTDSLTPMLLNNATGTTAVLLTLHWKGMIDQFPIYMTLEWDIKNKTLQGEYVYSNQKDPQAIALEGSFINEVLYLTEKTINDLGESEKTGEFQLDAKNLNHLNGFWQKNKQAKARQVALQLQEKELNELFQLQFTYEVMDKKSTNSNNEQTYPYLQKLSSSKNGKTHQVFSSLPFEALLTDLNNKYPLLNLKDINFDGYVDLKIPLYFPEASKNDYTYLYFLYDHKTDFFVAQPKLNELGVLSFNAREKKVMRYDADGNGNEKTYTYQWNKNELELVRTEEVEEDNAYTTIKTYKTVNQKPVEIKSVQVPFATQ